VREEQTATQAKTRAFPNMMGAAEIEARSASVVSEAYRAIDQLTQLGTSRKPTAGERTA
jgi:hypothetical protein